MGKVICIANRKGGVGKTTTAHALACGLARHSHKILAVDMDGQSNLTDICGATAERGTYELLTGKANAAELIISTAHGIDLLPATAATNLADIDVDGVDVFRRNLATVRNKYDDVIIDTPPSAGLLTLNALNAADIVIIPAGAEAASLEGVRQLAEMIEGVKVSNPALTVDGILITRYMARSRLSALVLDMLTAEATEMNTRIYETRIREGVAAKEAYLLRKSIFERRSKVAADYDAWLSELMGGVHA